MRALALALVMLASAAVLAGCEAGYIAHAAYEEGRLLWRRKPIDTVLALVQERGRQAGLYGNDAGHSAIPPSMVRLDPVM